MKCTFWSKVAQPTNTKLKLQLPEFGSVLFLLSVASKLFTTFAQSQKFGKMAANPAQMAQLAQLLTQTVAGNMEAKFGQCQRSTWSLNKKTSFNVAVMFEGIIRNQLSVEQTTAFGSSLHVCGHGFTLTCRESWLFPARISLSCKQRCVERGWLFLWKTEWICRDEGQDVDHSVPRGWVSGRWWRQRQFDRSSCSSSCLLLSSSYSLSYIFLFFVSFIFSSSLYYLSSSSSLLSIFCWSLSSCSGLFLVIFIFIFNPLHFLHLLHGSLSCHFHAVSSQHEDGDDFLIYVLLPCLFYVHLLS